jgi:hypothetical protein
LAPASALLFQVLSLGIFLLLQRSLLQDLMFRMVLIRKFGQGRTSPRFLLVNSLGWFVVGTIVPLQRSQLQGRHRSCGTY